MLLYYAMGGGLGHLTRAVAFLNTLSLAQDAAIITSSSWAEDPRVIGGIRAIRPPAALEDDRGEFGNWIRERIRAESPGRFVVDSFPAGILGELSGLTLDGDCEFWHVARLLKWENYLKRLDQADLPSYDLVWETEPLHTDHEIAVKSATKELRAIELTDPLPVIGVPHIETPYWIVVHSGPPSEVEDLLLYAIELRKKAESSVRIVLVSPVKPAVSAPSVSMIDVFPAWPFFDRADRIVSAAGFNVMRQAAPYRNRHWFVPFPRALDDQYTRASRVREQLGR